MGLRTTDEQAGDDVANVARKLEKRIAVGNGDNRPKLMTVSVGVPGLVEEELLAGHRSALPQPAAVGRRAEHAVVEGQLDDRDPGQAYAQGPPT